MDNLKRFMAPAAGLCLIIVICWYACGDQKDPEPVVIEVEEVSTDTITNEEIEKAIDEVIESMEE